LIGVWWRAIADRFWTWVAAHVAPHLTGTLVEDAYDRGVARGSGYLDGGPPVPFAGGQVSDEELRRIISAEAPTPAPLADDPAAIAVVAHAAPGVGTYLAIQILRAVDAYQRRAAPPALPVAPYLGDDPTVTDAVRNAPPAPGNWSAKVAAAGGPTFLCDKHAAARDEDPVDGPLSEKPFPPCATCGQPAAWFRHAPGPPAPLVMP
jgi:hypothetical protein